MAKLKRRSRSSGFEEKHGDWLHFCIGPPVEMTPELERDLAELVAAEPTLAKGAEAWKQSNAERLAERAARRAAKV